MELALREVFERRTLAKLAERVEAALQSGGPASLPAAPPLRPRTAGEHLAGSALSFAQQRLWFIDQLEPGSSLYNMPAVLRVEGQWEEQAYRLTAAALPQRESRRRVGLIATDWATGAIRWQAGAAYDRIGDASFTSAMATIDVRWLDEHAAAAVTMTRWLPNWRSKAPNLNDASDRFAGVDPS